MIFELSVYNKWKRSTLDRLTGKHRAALDRVIWAHLQSIRQQVEDALRAGKKSISVQPPSDKELDKVFVDHQADVTHVGISDGMQEIKPSKNLSWMEPVEHSFRTLAERTQRDRIFKDVWDKIFKNNKAEVKKNVIDTKGKYLNNIKDVFKEFANDYFGREEWNKDPKSAANEFLQTVFKKNKTEAEAVFRTETTRYFNDAREKYFKDNTSTDFVQLIAVTDGRISKICESRDYYVIPIGKAGQKKFKPPFHVNCRTIQSPLNTNLKSDTKQVEDNLGSEFGQCVSKTSGKTFWGKRSPPNVPLPKGWV